MSTELVVQDRPHASISPSSFARAEACTMSVHLASTAPPRLATPDSLAGSAAHAILEECLAEGLDTLELCDLRTVRVDGHDVEVDGEMFDAVQVVLDWVRQHLSGRDLIVEQAVHLRFAEEHLGRPMYGWVDVAAADCFPVVVVDAKFGFNPVPADAVQLGLYILAIVLDITDGSLDGDGVAGTAVVAQPNAQGDPVRTHDWTWADLRALRDRVVGLLQRIRRHDFTYQFNDGCRWCPAAGLCPHLAAVSRDAALTRVAPTPEMVASGEVSVQQLEEWFDLAPTIDHWLRRFHDTVQDYLTHGGRMRNAKLVRKKTNRRWRDANDDVTAAELARLDIDPWQKKLITPAEAERRLPPAKRGAVEPLAEKPVGELTVAPMDDPKPAVDVGATLRAALRSSVAAGYLAAAKSNVQTGERRSKDD